MNDVVEIMKGRPRRKDNEIKKYNEIIMKLKTRIKYDK